MGKSGRKQRKPDVAIKGKVGISKIMKKTSRPSNFLDKVSFSPFTYTLHFCSITIIGIAVVKLAFLLQMKMRLSGGHFRMINEKLYTCSYVSLHYFSFVSFLLLYLYRITLLAEFHR